MRRHVWQRAHLESSSKTSSRVRCAYCADWEVAAVCAAENSGDDDDDEEAIARRNRKKKKKRQERDDGYGEVHKLLII